MASSPGHELYYLDLAEQFRARPFLESERPAFVWGFAEGLRGLPLGLIRFGPEWPADLDQAAAATYGLIAGGADRQRQAPDFAFAKQEADNRPQPPSSPWPAFDLLRPLRLADGAGRWWLGFTTADDGNSYYGWEWHARGGQALTVSDVIELLGLEHAAQVVDYSQQALWAIPKARRADAREFADDPDGLRGAKEILAAGERRLQVELAAARLLLPLEAPGPRGRL